jgi:hypothetical protein
MVPYYGDFAEDAIVYMPINTFDSNDPTASVTVTNLVNTDVHIHKDGGTTQRNNAAGITMTIDYDSITGNHLLIIDTADDTVEDFWQAGHEYQVRVEGITVDGGTINAWVGAFSIERAGGALALIKSATYGLSALKTLIDDLPTAVENADALLNRDMSAVSDTNARSPLNALRFLRNKWSISGTTLTVTKEDDSTSAWTGTVTSSESANPITGNDPS